MCEFNIDILIDYAEVTLPKSLDGFLIVGGNYSDFHNASVDN